MDAHSIADFSPVRGCSLVIGFSGGADSTALTRLLADAREAYDLRLIAAHVHHGLRGEEADGDATFCEALCARLAIPFRLVRVDLSNCSGGVETAAREARHAALRKIRDEERANYIALAHHSRDQAETVLMHLLRGAGMSGLGGMRELQDGLYRPLLDVSPERLREYLAEIGQPWREDETNARADNPRNAIRLDLLPRMERVYPGSERAIGRCAAILRREDALLGEMTARFLNERAKTLPGGMIRLSTDGAHPALLGRAFYALLAERADGDHIARLLTICEGNGDACSLPGGWRAERVGGTVYLLPAAPYRVAPATLNLEGETQLGEIGTLTATPCAPVPISDDPYTQALDADVLQGCVLRTRRPGDRMRPLGTGEKKLKEIMIDRKIDRPLRDLTPMLAKEDRALWLIGVCVSDEAKITPATRRAVRLRFRPAVGNS